MEVVPPLLVGLGLLIGAYGTLIGVGGSVVLVPALMLLYPEASPSTLTGISLAFVFVNALSGASAYSRQRRIDYRSGIMFALATVPGTIVGVWSASLISRDSFALVFGGLLLLFSVFLMLRPRREVLSSSTCIRGTSRTLVDARGGVFVYSFDLSLGIALSSAVGFVAGLMGIGGGIIHVPILIYLLHFPTHIATATSHFILVFTALAGSLTHAVGGTYSNSWQPLPWLAIGVIPGAWIGAWFSQKLRGGLIARLLALALALVGVRLLLLGM